MLKKKKIHIFFLQIFVYVSDDFKTNNFFVKKNKMLGFFAQMPLSANLLLESPVNFTFYAIFSF